MPVRIGDLLLKEKRITSEQLQQALNHQKANGGKLGYNLVKMGFIKDEEITALLSKQYGVPSINLTQFELDPVVIKLVPAGYRAANTRSFPLSRSGATLDDRDDGSDQCLRDGRHQVHDRLQRRAGRGVRDRGDGRDSALLPDRRSRPAAKGAPARESSGPSTLDMATKGLEEMQALESTRRGRGARGAGGDQRRGAGQAGRGCARSCVW